MVSLPTTKRSSINVNFVDYVRDYQWINHVRIGGTGLGFTGTYFSTPGNPVWNRSILGADGFPNAPGVNGNSQFGNHIFIPASTDFAGPYVIQWDGQGRLTLGTGTWTELGVVSGSGYVRNANGDWSGTNIKLRVMYSGPASSGDGTPWRGLNTNQSGGGYFKNLRIYREEDEADLLAGKTFRRAYLQQLVDLNPSALRFMNWTGFNHCEVCRFENRAQPAYLVSGGYNCVISLPYPAGGGIVNRFTIPSVAGMPVAHQHGELVQTRMDVGLARAGQMIITNISKSNPAVVTYVSLAGVDPINGDRLTFRMPTGAAALPGMTQMDYRTETVANLDTSNPAAKTFECSGLNSTGFTDLARVATTGNTAIASRTITGIPSTTLISTGMNVSGPGIPIGNIVESKTSTTVTMANSVGIANTATEAATGAAIVFSSGRCMQYVTLDVGLRGEAPVLFTDSGGAASSYSNNYIRAGDYKTFHYDKALYGTKDAAGNPIFGAWVFGTSAPQVYLPYNVGTALEICTALVNEVNELSLSQGINNPVHMYITIPHNGLLSMDPDHSEASNFSIGSVDVCLNGANGWPGLTPRADLLVEFSNELWNTAFTQNGMLARKGGIRDPVNGVGSSTYLASLRSVIMTRDIRSVFGANPRIKFVLAGQGTIGISPGSPNHNKAFGGTAYNNDVLYDGTTPMDNHDMWAWAAYYLAGSTYDAANLIPLADAWAAAAGDPVAQEAYCATYVNNGVGVPGSGFSETMNTYQTVHLPAYAAAMHNVGRTTIMYEGGWDRRVTNSTTNGNAFLKAVKRSAAWAAATNAFFNAWNNRAGAFMPADYIQVEERWGHAFPDTYLGGVEGANNDGSWVAMGERNRSFNETGVSAAPGMRLKYRKV